MERDSSKHGPRLDDELARDVDARTAPASRLGADEVAARRELSRHLRPGAFPADRDRLVAEAEDNQAPGPVVEALRGLPAGAEFHTAHEVWIGLTEPEAAGDRAALRGRAAAEPLDDAGP